jgi:hypothetical protein
MSWQNLLTTLDTMRQHATSDSPQATAQLEKSIVRLGQVARDLVDVAPPDQEMYIRIHAALNQLGQALPAERTAIRQKIVGLVNRSKAQQAYNKMSDRK